MNTSGLSPQNPNKYVGPNVYLAIVVQRARRPTGADYRQPETGKLYAINSFWQVSINPSTGIQGEIWVLTKIVANVAYWIMLGSGSSGPLVNITVDAATAPGTNPVIPTATGNITITGAQVATGTIGAHVLRTHSVAANEFTIEVQRSTAVASTDSTKNGVSHYNSAEFTVDSNGFVSLTGGGVAITSLTGDDSLPVVPTAGNINLDGVTVLNATHAKPVFFAKNATSTEELDVQVTTISTSGAKSINKAGLASFDSTSFNVDSATGWISLITPSPLSQINVQRVTATGAFTYTPTANMKYVIVELVGGGGGSGGVAATTANIAMGGGGSAGGYAKFLLTAAQVGVSLTGSVGAGGTAGTPGFANFGGTGGSTTLATTSAWTAAGGTGGQGADAGSAQFYTGATGGTITTGTGTLIMAMTGGYSGSAAGNSTTGYLIGGFGGSSFYGSGGAGGANNNNNSQTVGISGTGFGSAPSGAINLGTVASQNGKAGQPGIAIFTEFI